MITNHSFLQSLAVNNLFAQINNLNLSGDALFGTGVTIVKALLILIIGLILANIIKGLVKSWLKKTDIDNKIAGWVTGDSGTQSNFAIEEWIGEIVGWILTLLVVVAFLDAIDLKVVSEPLNALLSEITQFLPRLGGAILLLAVAWALATIVKLLVKNAFKKFNIDQRLNQQIREDQEPEDDFNFNDPDTMGLGQTQTIGGTTTSTTGTTTSSSGGTDDISLGETIGNALYWLIFLLFLPNVLSVLQLEGTLRPLEQLVDEILGIIPNVFAAILIAAVGWVVAKIVKKVVTNLLKASGVNNIGAKFGIGATRTTTVGSTGSSSSSQSLAQIIGTVAYVLVLIPIAITALDALQIEVISEPATEMLNQVLDLLPKLFSAIVILGLAYVGGQYLSELVTNLLTSVGFNNVTQWLGIEPSQSKAVSTMQADVSSGRGTASTNQTPSQVVGAVVLVIVMLVAALTAVDILQIEALQEVVAFILVLAGQVLVGMLIFAVGLYFSNLVFRLIANSGTAQSNFLAQTARISILVLVSAMALERIGIAPNIVNLAFGLLTAGISVAIALAFGLGGRETAGKVVDEWFGKFKRNDVPQPKTSPTSRNNPSPAPSPSSSSSSGSTIGTGDISTTRYPSTDDSDDLGLDL